MMPVSPCGSVIWFFALRPQRRLRRPWCFIAWVTSRAEAPAAVRILDNSYM